MLPKDTPVNGTSAHIEGLASLRCVSAGGGIGDERDEADVAATSKGT